MALDVRKRKYFVVFETIRVQAIFEYAAISSSTFYTQWCVITLASTTSCVSIYLTNTKWASMHHRWSWSLSSHIYVAENWMRSRLFYSLSVYTMNMEKRAFKSTFACDFCGKIAKWFKRKIKTTCSGRGKFIPFVNLLSTLRHRDFQLDSFLRDDLRLRRLYVKCVCVCDLDLDFVLISFFFCLPLF